MLKATHTSCLLTEASMTTNVVTQVTTREVIHDKVKVLTILEGVVHVDDEWILQLSQDLALVDDRLDTAFGYDSCLAHLLHGKVLLGLFALHTPYLAKAALADAEVVNKVCFRDS